MRLRFFVSQSILQSAWNKCASVGIIQVAWILYKVNALLKSVVLMGNTVMKSLTNRIIIILLHRIWKKSTSRHFTKCQIFNLWKNLVHRQYEWNCEVLIIYHIRIFITTRPRYLCYSRTQLEGWLVFANQYNGCTSKTPIPYQTTLAKKRLNVPSVHFFSRYATMYFLEHHASLGNSNLIQIVYGSIWHNLSRPVFGGIDRFFKDDSHSFLRQFHQRILYPLPCLFVRQHGATRQMLRNMDNPYCFMGVIRYKLFYRQSFRRQVSALFCKFERSWLRIGRLPIKG